MMWRADALCAGSWKLCARRFLTGGQAMLLVHCRPSRVVQHLGTVHRFQGGEKRLFFFGCRIRGS